MTSVFAMTKLYFLGSVRRQVHLATVFLGLILLGLPAYVNAFSLGQNAFERVSTDFGLTLIGYFAVGMALTLASSSIPKDIENRSLYPILARPVTRAGYILAHFLAIAVLLGLSLLFLAVCLSVALSVLTKKPEFGIFVAVAANYATACIVASVTLCISTIASPALAGTVGAFVFLVGSLPGAFIRFFLVEDRDSAFSATLANGLKSLLPDLSVLSLKDPIVHHIEFSHAYLPAAATYAVLWMAIPLLAATLMFGKRDL